MTKARIALVALLLIAPVAGAQNIVWKPIGGQSDFRVEWASNVIDRDAHTVSTLMRLVYAREDTAPNNRRFDNERIGVRIRCSEMTYFVLGKAYSMGDREVHNVSLASVGGYEPVAGTFVERFASEACKR